MAITTEVNGVGSPIIFLGGVFPPSQIDFIQRESKGVVQSAADALQKGIIRGIASHNREMVIVNLPYVGSYPQLFKKAVFPSTVDSVDGVPLYGQRFVLVKFLKVPFRILGAFRGLRSIDKENRPVVATERPVILIYSAHLPFLIAALAHRALRRKFAICLIMPDFLEFMAEGGRLYRMAKFIESSIFNRLVSKVDYFVVLTKAMAERLGLPDHRYVVVEGIADEFAGNLDSQSGNLDKRIFMYAGTLAARYGVVDLVSAFKLVRSPDAELWICGEGDSREKIEAAARMDSRIKFFGQVPRDKARKLQASATILVNPRTPVGEFTKYSFPSKTMEYMASGRPVLMHRLPGVPEEYHRYFVSPDNPSIEAFARTMELVAGWSNDRLAEFGERAREFVLGEKNATVQTAKILRMIDRNERSAHIEEDRCVLAAASVQ